MRERELLGRGWTARVFADDLGPLLDAWRAANAAGAEFEHEFRLLLPGGRVRWVHGRSAVIRDAAGRPTRTVGTVEDVTERRVAVERTRRLLALTTALASTLTADEVAHAVAEHAAAALGATSCVVALVSADGTRLERVGTGALPAAIAPDYTHMPVDVRVPIAEAVRSGRPVVVADGAALRERYPDARAVWDELDVHAVLAAPIELDGRRLGVVGFRFSTAREILDDDLAFVRAACQQCAVSLERARLFAAERAARTDADTANRAKSEFLARMSHELRTPLNAIAGHVQLVEIGIHGPVTPAQHEALGRAARAQQHLLGLINDVLNFAKLEAGRIQFDVREVAAAEVVDGVRHMVEPQLAAKGLGFELRAPTDPAVLVWADHDKLTQVLLNLLSNAIKFTPAADGRGLVRLELLAPADDPAHATFRVSDTGIGIPADRLDAIFEPFVQVSPGRSAFTREHPGSGLGLAISRDLVTGMGGELTVESAIGAGSAFTVLLRRSVTATGERTERRARDDRRVGVDRRGPPRRSP
jgi:signal transduction histidine kinase